MSLKFMKLLAVVALIACFHLSETQAGHKKRPLHTAQNTPTAKANGAVAQIIFDKGLQGGWQDWGWAPREVVAGKPASLHMNKYGGWILAKRGLEPHFSALGFDMKAPAKFGDFLEVRLANEGDDSFPRIMVGPENRHGIEAGYIRVHIKMSDLNPSSVAFDRIYLRATKSLGDDPVTFNKIVLFAGEAGPVAVADLASFKSHPASLQVDCRAPSHAISPLIYGIAYNPQHAGKDAWQWDMGPTTRRWGGNPASRFNWKLNAWNTAMDWFFTNVNYTDDPAYSWKKFLDENRAHKVQTALTVPMLGWAAKDQSSVSFPVSVYGPQQYSNNDAGNGKRKGGGNIANSDPHMTSVESGPEFEAEWVKAIRQYDAETGSRNVHEYILDNEPALWNSTHRDVHPQALSYDELLERTIRYGSAVRQADPDAIIAGFAEWGWPAYFFSAKDAEVGFSLKPDRRAHGDVPLLDWYLQKLHEHQRKTGERILDVVDLHYYPQTDGTYGQNERTDAQGAERRIRATRSLWDPTYKDDSWINEKIQLLPRLRDVIAANYPGLKMSIGEYNFGGERHISGGLAEAEALGRFGQFDVYSAYYWTYPPANSCTFQAFRAYRNYDGQGARFLEHSVQAVGDSKTSIFVSQNDAKDKMVAIVLNLDAKEVADAQIELAGCGNFKVHRAFVYNGGPQGIRKVDEKIEMVRGTVMHKLLPYSLNIFELTRE